MKKTMQISVPDRCGESWYAMHSCGSNKHCEACNKLVIDFTKMSDAEIFRFLEERSGQQVCGRFTTSQLNRPLRVSKSSWIRPLAAAAIPAMMMLSSADVVAQSSEADQQQQIQTEQTVNQDQVTISGTITDHETGEPLIFANIYLQGTKVGASADLEGKFSLTVDRELLKAHPELVVAYLGYHKQIVRLNTVVDSELDVKLDIDMQASRAVLGFVIIEKEEDQKCPRPKEELKEQRKHGKKRK